MTIEVLTGPAYEPVSLAEARLWCRLEADETDEDASIRMLIKAMRNLAENKTHRAFIQRSLKLSLPSFPIDSSYGNKILLPYPPAASVESFEYVDTSGALTVLAADQYVLHNECEPGYIIPAYGVSWPSLRSVPNAVQITFTAGYAPGSPADEQGSQDTMPAELRVWMQTRLATLFENREQLIVGTIVSPIPRDFSDGLLDPLVVGTRLF